MDAVKIEGGFRNRVRAVRAVVEAGVAVVGHVGLTPQSISVLGGFRPAAQSGARVLGQWRGACVCVACVCVGGGWGEAAAAAGPAGPTEPRLFSPHPSLPRTPAPTPEQPTRRCG